MTQFEILFNKKRQLEVVRQIYLVSFVICLGFTVLGLTLGNIPYAMLEFAGAILILILLVLHKKKWYQPMIILSTLVFAAFFAFFMKFGSTNGHYLIFVAAVLISIILENYEYKNTFKYLLWGIAAFLFIGSHYYLVSVGKIVVSTTLEKVVFYPNLLLALFLTFFMTNSFIELLKKKNQKLHEINKLKDHLISILSHDMIAPVNSAIGVMDMASQKDISHDQLESLTKNIQGELYAIREIMTNTLMWIKGQKECTTLFPEDIQLAALLRNLVSVYRIIADNKSVDLKLEVNCDQHQMVNSDREMLNIVLRNLIYNAIKFSPEKTGAVRIVVDKKDDQVVLAIIDNGVGIEPSTLEKILSGNISSRGTKQELGFGMGLQIVQIYTDLLHLDFDIKSSVGKGTVIQLTFPL
jgi:signal transduction histidine kinase